MWRKVLTGLLLPLLIVMVGLGQSSVLEQLQSLLLTQEELNALSKELGLGEDWVVRTLDHLNPEPPGAEKRTMVATYVNTNTEIALIIGLLDFEAREPADRFLSALLAAKPVQSSRDLLAEVRERPNLLPETLQKETDKILLLQLEDGQQQIVLQRLTLVIFLRTAKAAPNALTEDQLIQVANRQLSKILESCKNAQNKPTYCERP